MSTRLVIAYGIIALVLAFAIMAAWIRLRRRRRRPSRDHLRVDLIAHEAPHDSDGKS